MPTRLIVEEQGGSMRVSLHREGQIAPEPSGDWIPFDTPLRPEELEEIRWYLESYLPAPYAVWEERGSRIQRELKDWGESLFECLFGKGMPGRDGYIAAREIGPFELWISSSSPGFLGLPWELLRDAGTATALALNLASVNRTIPASIEATTIRRGERLRVLMVIARPQGTNDIPYQMIARPLLKRLELVSGAVELEVLRPPTVEALRRKLEEARLREERYDILHFDGHGTFSESPGFGLPSGSEWYQAPGGYLEFENETGGKDPVSSTDFAAILRNAEIPLLVLNACKSGRVVEGLGPEAVVAVRLLQEGVGAVVAMGYRVYAIAAAEFMAVFYEALFDGKTVSEAVTEGRRQLHRSNLRPSPKGLMALEDWIVPVHYARREISFPQLEGSLTQGPSSLSETLSQLRDKARERATQDLESAAEDPLRPEEHFVGRDAEYYELDRSLRTEHVVLVHGVGGTGKTELVKAFARWLQASRGVDDPQLVFFHSFEPGLASFGLKGVLTPIGLRLFGSDFVRNFPTLEERRRAVLEVLRRHRALLIWDSFETVHSMPDPTGVTPPLQGKDLADLSVFLTDVALNALGGVLIASRSPEGWLGDGVHRMELEGLKLQDAHEYADRLLASYPKAQASRESRAYGDLMEMLKGHPLSIRLILPYLNETDPQSLVDWLRGHEELPAGFEEDDRRFGPLNACIHYSFLHIPEEHRRRLPALCLFESVVDASVLSLFSLMMMLVPERFDSINLEAWERTLNTCTELGLLTKIGDLIYRMHPILPVYLRALWRKEVGEAFEEQHEGGIVANIYAHADTGRMLLEQILWGNAESALAVIAFQLRTLGTVVNEALKRGMFAEALKIFAPLDTFWNLRGLTEEAHGWVDRCRVLIEDADGSPPALITDAGELWLFMVSSQAHRHLEAGDLNKAEAEYDSILHILEESKTERIPPLLSKVYHNMGVIAQEKRDTSLAIEYYRKAIEIMQTTEEVSGLAGTLCQVGIVLREKGDLENAKECYQQALKLSEHQGDKLLKAKIYHELGVLSFGEGELETAEKRHRKAFVIVEKLNDRPMLASTYSQLGLLAHARRDIEAAEQWHRKALKIREDLDNRPGLASTCANLGLLAQTQGNETEALDWMVRSVSLFSEFPHPETDQAAVHLARLTNKLSFEALEDSWRRCTGKPLPESVRNELKQIAGT
jgi:tetratricopeptide (TPR) repeat protein